MLVLGAVLAGGRSTRFGSDKCDFIIGGRRLIDHAIAALKDQADEIAVCGRAEPPHLYLPDSPHPQLGPLGALNSALQHAVAHGFDAVLSAPCDVFPLPADLLEHLGPPGPSHLLGQHAIGCWPARLSRDLELHIARGNRSVWSWIESCRSRAVDDCPLGLCNLNSRDQADALIASLKLQRPPLIAERN